VKRASNDPRQRRRQQRDQNRQAQAPKLSPSQVPTLGQYTVSSLIRHVYGEDCSVLIEQFGLIPTFNRALQKFTEEYAATLSTVVTPVEKKPVTRDVVVVKATPEAEPAAVLDLTPPKATSENRVSNDPRVRRRLAKLAAEQALEQAKNVQVEATETTESTVEVTPVVENTAEVAPTVAESAPTQETLAIEPVAEETTETPVEAEVAPIEVIAEVEAEAEVQDAVESTDVAETDDEKAKADKDKPARPRRPRGRPPKKTNPSAE